MEDIEGLARINGSAVALGDATLALTDEGVARGDGAFETIGVWDGRPFRLDDHLDRLTASLAAIGLDEPERHAIATEAAELCSEAGPRDGALRCYVTASGTRVVTWSPPPGPRPTRRLSTQPAPWIRPRGTYGPAGSKSMSYGPNMAATRAARAAGADDALLISLEGTVLEGPTFGVLWVRDGTVHAPGADLGIVDSISRRTVLELAEAAGITVSFGAWGLDAVLAADEVATVSSIRPLTRVERIDGSDLPGPGSIVAQLAEALDARRRGRTGRTS